jgi:D-alanyl-D-alanine carboxypeptidase
MLKQNRGAASHLVAALMLLGAAATATQASAASLLVEAKTGTVLSADAPNHLWYPASLTKMMTVYVALSEIEAGRLRFDDTIEVSRRAANQNPVNFGLRAGQLITVREAIDAAIVASANDAAVALAEKIAETEDAFATRMTGIAQELGMTRTVFQNASGLPADGQVTTARDMAVLAMSFLHDYPQHYPLFSQRSVTIGKRSRGTVNSILDAYEGADGMKTGFTCASGYNLVASAERDGRRLIGIVLGSRDGGQRSKEMKQLLNEGFAGATPPTTTLIALAEQMTPADDGMPPTVLSGGACDTPQLIGSSIIESPGELSGWGVTLGDYRSRSKAQDALQNIQAKLGSDAVAGRPAIIKQGGAGLTRYNVLLAGLKQTTARKVCKALQDKNEYCVALSPKILETRYASR